MSGRGKEGKKEGGRGGVLAGAIIAADGPIYVLVVTVVEGDVCGVLSPETVLVDAV